ncbi:hypothetical protein J27TS8_27590 [Robertmurraya siralis]|uniref:Transglycosylase SLT domain-containing protein n=1 Tax=Robertmurraya siralis TaxID=77777 RepID=A0A920BUN1_9BACI|nr:lytic transglycosylase domain-containing protein [Robertmurraya siralis]GIN62766.1 hypothetical protein J27TS8_27590 [Robertmurraya siralis]
MRRFVILASFILFFTANYASAQVDDFLVKEQDIKAQRDRIKSQMISLEGLSGAAKEMARNENIRLGIQDNRLAAIQKAYEKAINILNNQNIYSEFTSAKLVRGEKVPSEYIPIYKAAAAQYGVDWYVLAAIHEIETNFSRIEKMVSYAGAIGHMQFMPTTFAVYGVDGNGDGHKSPWDLEDAVFSAANYLAASGYSKNIRKAIWHYNHADWYVNLVLEKAAKIRSS